MATKTKTKAKKEEVLDLTDILNWSDKKCTARDKKGTISHKVLRDVLIQYKAVNDKYLNLLSVLKSGALIGYEIECPNCHVTKIVTTGDLKRTEEVTCEECGTSYWEIPNIKDIATVLSVHKNKKEEEEVTNADKLEV